MSEFQFPRGSEWRKWDLHAHTPLDHEWEGAPNLQTETQKEEFARCYVERAKGADLALIAITDHNFCDRVDSLLIPYIQRFAEGLTILPGFEVTVSDCGGTRLKGSENIVALAEELGITRRLLYKAA